ncbi:hypothetical protein HDU92_006496 [Lobulomyces angularis]|nr:hypothetical protein HDU92_006496 [Lobulomyces angularis]
MNESKAELISWVNTLLKLDYKKIEELGTGAAYCQIIDSIYGNVAMNKVKFKCYMEHDFLFNYKILQSSFNANNIEKEIFIEQLAKCRQNENYQLLSWLKKYWDTHYGGTQYDPEGRRREKPKSASLIKGKRIEKSNQNLEPVDPENKQVNLKSSLSSTPTGKQKSVKICDAPNLKLPKLPTIKAILNPYIPIPASISKSCPIHSRSSMNAVVSQVPPNSADGKSLNSRPSTGTSEVVSAYSSRSRTGIKDGNYNLKKGLEKYKIRVNDMQRKIDELNLNKSKNESELNNYRLQIEEMKQIMEWKNRDNINEVFEQLKLILV